MSTDATDPKTVRKPGRPRQVSDDAIFLASLQVLLRFGSEGITLGRIAEAVGVTPAAIRQRFGSKRGLLVELARRRAEQTEARFKAARAACASPLEALYQALGAELDGISEPPQVANAFSAYTDNIGDPEMSAAFAEELGAMERHIRELLEEAVAAGEMRGPVTAGLVSVVVAAAEGTMFVWAIVPRGELTERVREAIGVVVGNRLG